MKEQQIDQAFTDIVNSVVKWQLEGVDPKKFHRAEILKAARILCRASGAGYWLEAAKVHPVNHIDEWYPVQWYPSECEAICAMKEEHAEGANGLAHRVVSEKSIVDGRMIVVSKVA